MLGFFISGSRAQLVGLRLLDIKKQTKCNQLGAYPALRDHSIILKQQKIEKGKARHLIFYVNPSLRDHSIILKQQKMKRAKPVDINAAP
jgi:hypothetical protein